jgi:hypothetical protein
MDVLRAALTDKKPTRTTCIACHGGVFILFKKNGSRFFLPSGDTRAQRSQGPVAAFGWHRYLNRFAVGLKDGGTDFIGLYDMDSESWLPTVLKHQFQRGVTCLQWQPKAGGCLAVNKTPPTLPTSHVVAPHHPCSS